MSHKAKHLIIEGLIFMTMAGATTTANGSDVKVSIVNPQGLLNPSSFGYSQATVVAGGRRIAYISGQGGADGTGRLSPDFDAQVEQAYANLRTALDGVGAKPSDVAKLTIHVVDHDPSKLGMLTNQVLEMFGKSLPAQTLVPVPKLALDGMLFEVEAVAVLD